jgi:hypothetical protein
LCLCRLALRSLLLSMFLCEVVSHDATANGADHGMVSGIVASHPADDRAFQAAGGVCRSGCCEHQCRGCECKCVQSFHSELPRVL